MKIAFLSSIIVFLAVAGCQTTINPQPILEPVPYTAIPDDVCFDGSKRKSFRGEKINYKFHNLYHFDVEVVWLNYDGQPRLPGHLIASNAIWDTYAYVTHPFAFVRSDTGECVGMHTVTGAEEGETIQIPADLNQK